MRSYTVKHSEVFGGARLIAKKSVDAFRVQLFVEWGGFCVLHEMLDLNERDKRNLTRDRNKAFLEREKNALKSIAERACFKAFALSVSELEK